MSHGRNPMERLKVMHDKRYMFAAVSGSVLTVTTILNGCYMLFATGVYYNLTMSLPRYISLFVILS